MPEALAGLTASIAGGASSAAAPPAVVGRRGLAEVVALVAVAVADRRGRYAIPHARAAAGGGFA